MFPVTVSAFPILTALKPIAMRHAAYWICLNLQQTFLRVGKGFLCRVLGTVCIRALKSSFRRGR